MAHKNTSLNSLVKNRNLIIGAVGAMLALIILMIITAVNFEPAGRVDPSEEVNLVMWGVWDESEMMRDYITNFRTLYPAINIEYRKLTIQNYERELISALAAGRGPDIFAMHHTWLGKHKDLMQPMPEGIMTLREYQERFVDVVSDDFVDQDGSIWGFPLYTDTMALFYNRDAFNDASISQPPATWEQFQDNVQQLTRIDEFGRIDQAGATMGTGININRSPDILSVLMLQSGAQMTEPGDPSRVTFNQSQTINGQASNPAELALQFYTDFANPRTNVYTWNAAQNYSVDAFYERKAAMMLGYSYQVEQIKSRAPRLNWGIAPLPQISDTSAQTNYANYWGYTASVQSQNAGAAYLFLSYLTEQENAQNYFLNTKRPTARRDLVDIQADDTEYGTFVRQVLQAKTWPQPDNDAVDEIFIETIEDVNSGIVDYRQAMTRAQAEIQLLADENRQ